MMTQYAFRTECAFDGKQVPALLSALGVRDFTGTIVNDIRVPVYEMVVFRFQSPITLDEFRRRMEEIVESDSRFTDMHRCYQTLAVGYEPDEKWFLR